LSHEQPVSANGNICRCEAGVTVLGTELNMYIKVTEWRLDSHIYLCVYVYAHVKW